MASLFNFFGSGQSAEVKQRLENMPEAVKKSLQAQGSKLTVEVLEKLEKVPPVLLTKAVGEKQVMDKLVAIATMEKPPEMPGFFGKIGRAFKNSFSNTAQNALTSASIMTAMSFATDKATDAGWISHVPMLSVRPRDTDREHTQALLQADLAAGRLTQDQFNAISSALPTNAQTRDRYAEILQGRNLPPEQIESMVAARFDGGGAMDYAKRFGMIAAVVGGFSTIASLVNGLKDDSIKAEITMEQQIHHIMNSNVASAGGRNARGRAQHDDDDEITVPTGLPHGRGGAGRSANV